MGNDAPPIPALRRFSVVAAVIAFLVACIGWATTTSNVLATAGAPTYDSGPLANPLPIVAVKNPTAAVSGAFSVGADGAARYSIPLEAIPGPVGMTPALSLDYSSRSGNGYFGVGFSLSGVGAITRCPKNLADDKIVEAVKLDKTDPLCLGGQRLVAVKGEYGGNGTEYRTNPQTFARIVSYRNTGTADDGPEYFEVRTRDGLIHLYGYGDQDVIGPRRVGWPIVSIRDRQGNRIQYSYKTMKVPTGDSQNLPGMETVMRKLERINYGNFGAGFNSSWSDRRILFEYQDRPDDIEAYAHDVGRIVFERVSKIEMQRWVGSTMHNGSYVDARSYTLSYKNDGATKLSKLDSIKQCGTSATDCLPKTTFSWQKGAAGFQPVTPLSLPHTKYLSPILVLDVNGDGLQDIAHVHDDDGTSSDGAVWRVFTSDKNAPFTSDSMFTSSQGTSSGALTQAFAIDYDLDGRTDILPRVGGANYLSEPIRPLLSRGNGTPYWANTLVRVNTGYTGPVNSMFHHATFADFDGDGYQDLLERHTYFPGAPWNANQEHWTVRFRSGTVSPSLKPEALPNGATDFEAFGKAHVLGDLGNRPAKDVFPLDIDGDGRSEIVHRLPGNGLLRAMRLTNRDAEGLSPTPSFDWPMPAWVMDDGVQRVFADVNGDGLVDLITNVDGPDDIDQHPGNPNPKVYVSFNLGGRYGSTQSAVTTNLAFDLKIAVVVDYDGDGRHDVLVPAPKTLPINPSTKWDMHLLRSNGSTFTSQLWLGMDFNVPVVKMPDGSHIAHPDYFATQGPQVIDADGDGQDDLILLQRKTNNEPNDPSGDGFLFFRHQSSGTPPDLLTGVQEGLNAAPVALAIQYRSLAGNPGFYTRGKCDRQYFNCGMSAYYAVSRVSRDAGLLANAEGATVVSEYLYKNSITDKLTRNWLGFAEQLIISYPSDASQPAVTTRRFYSNQDARRDPRLDEEWVYGGESGARWLERHRQEWSNKDQTVDVGGINHVLHYDYVSKSETWSYELPDFYLDEISISAFDENPLFDTDQYRYREVLHNQILEMDDYGNVLRNRSYVGPGAFTTEIRTDYMPPDLDAWLISRPKQIKTSRFLPPGCFEVSTCTETRTVEILGYAQTPSGTPTLLPLTVRADADDPSQTTETTYDYDSYGNVTRTSVSGDVDGQGTSATRNVYVTYDPDGVFPHAVSNDLGQTVRMLHDPLLGVQRVVVDASGVRTDVQYDTLGRPVKAHKPTGVVSEIAYFVEDFGGSTLPRIETSDASGAKSERVFDRLGRPVADRFKGFDGKMRVSTRTYDALGTLRNEDALPVLVGAAAPPQLRYTYDSRGRRLTQSEPNSANPAAPYQRSWSYDKRTVTYTDTRGNKTVREYGMAGNLGRVTEAAGTPEQITREYRQDMGQRLVKSYVLGRETETANEFAWDRLGRMISRKDADRGLTTYRYNAFGELLSSIDDNGRETRNLYDVLGRMARTVTTQTTGNATKTLARTDYVYDIELATQDKQPGRLTGMTRWDYLNTTADGDEQQTKVDYDYDNFGRLLKEFHALPSETNPAIEALYTIGYSYDTLDRISQVVYPKLPGQSQPVRVQYGYADASSGGNGQLRAIDSFDNGVLRNLWQLTGTDEANRPMWTQTGDGVVKYRDYDWRGALSDQYLKTSTADACASCLSIFSSYGYDGEGNLSRRSDVMQGATERFEYDPLNRLKSSTVDDAPNARQDWSYDTLGNITQNTHRGTYHYEDPARPMRVTKLSGGTIGTVRTYAYDAVGNQTVRPGENIVYNEMNLPVRSQRPNGAVLASFLYGAGGERVRKTSSAGTTTYIRGIYERQRKGADIEHRLLVPGVAELPYKETNGIAVKQPERYVHGDHLGSTIAVVADDDPGAGLKAKVKEVRSYDAFGLTRNPDWKSGSYASVQTALVGQGYTGHNDDQELGLIDMKGRIYDPKLGRFLSADPLVSDPSVTQPWNPYAYVRNNPLSNTDPSGYEECMQRAYDGSCMSGGNGGYSPAVWDNVAETQRFGDARDSCSSGAGCFDENRLEREYERKSAINDAVQKANAERALKQHQENKIRESGGGNGPRTQKLCACAGADIAPGLVSGGAVATSLPAFINSGIAAGWLTAAEGAALSVGTGVSFIAIVGGTIYLVDTNPLAAEVAAGMGDPSTEGTAMAGAGFYQNVIKPLIDQLGKAKAYILQSSSSSTPKAQPKQPGPTIDKATGQEVGVFVVDPKGNTMIEPKGGSTVPAGKLGENTHTKYPNGSTYHRLDPLGHGGRFPGGHAHGHQMGTGPGRNNEGSPIDPRGNPVPANSPDAHWGIK